MSKEDLSRLPKWARLRIEKLEADVEYYIRKMKDMCGEEGAPNLGPPITVNLESASPTWLPRGSSITFMLGEGRDKFSTSSIECVAEKITRDGPWVLSIRSILGRVVISPESGNRILVRASEDIASF